MEEKKNYTEMYVLKKAAATLIDIDMVMCENHEKLMSVETEVLKNSEVTNNTLKEVVDVCKETNENIKKLNETMLAFVNALSEVLADGGK